MCFDFMGMGCASSTFNGLRLVFLFETDGLRLVVILNKCLLDSKDFGRKFGFENFRKFVVRVVQFCGLNYIRTH